MSNRALAASLLSLVMLVAMVGCAGRSVPPATSTASRPPVSEPTVTMPPVSKPSVPAPTVSKPAPKPSPSAPQKGQGLAGVWMGLYVPYGQYSPQERYLIMYEDGTFYHDMPLEGLEGFDREAARSSDAAGTYTFDGSSGTWKYDRTKVAATELKLNQDGSLAIGSDTYYRCAPVDGLRLAGAWANWANYEDPGFSVNGMKRIIRFAADGKFRNEGLFDDPGAGAYEIRNYTLLLKYDDGHVRKAAFSLGFKSAPQPSPESIFIARDRVYLVK